MAKKLGQGNVWDKAFLANHKGSFATRDRAFKTWVAVQEFSDRKKWDLKPETITPKQVRIFIEERTTKVSARSVQNEASHLRRAIEGAGKKVGNVRDPKNAFSSARLKVPGASRIGGKAAASPEHYAAAREKMDGDMKAGTGLIEPIGLRKKEMIMAEPSLKEWVRELNKTESSERGCYINVVYGTKGDRPRWVFIPADRVDKAIVAIAAAAASVKENGGFIIAGGTLKSAMDRYSNCMTKLGLVGDDSGHGLRRLFAHNQYRHYRNAGLSEKDALRRLSMDLGHGDQRGRWVFNNYLSGGEGGAGASEGDD